MGKPSKKAVSDLINQVAGQDVMTEKKLGQIMTGAKKNFDSKGMTGFLEYMRDVTQAPVSTDWMKGIMDQMKTSEGMNQVINQFKVPMQTKKESRGNKSTSPLKMDSALRTKRKKK